MKKIKLLTNIIIIPIILLTLCFIIPITWIIVLLKNEKRTNY